MLKTLRIWIQEHPYALAILYFIPYLIVFELLELFAVPKYYIHCALDDIIPFHESFIIPYFLWFPLLAVSLGYFLFKSKEEFLNLCFCMFTGMSICLLLYALLPNGLALRVEVENHNLLADVARLLYKVDTPTNVCPSIHVASTIAILCATLRSKTFQHPWIVKSLCFIVSLLICLSTVVLKQHSVVDVVAGVLLITVLYFVTYHMNWRAVLSKTWLRNIIK